MKNLIYFKIAVALLCTSSCFARPFGNEGVGGGNTLHGRPLESYIRDPKKTAGFAQLRKRHPQLFPQKIESNEAQLMNDVFARKAWYFVPGPLTALSSGTIGSAVSTEQAALQSFQSVWIDETLFKKMSADDQAKLLLHENFMNIRLLAFESETRQCQSVVYHQTESNCGVDSKKRTGSPQDLKAQDYENIRGAVQEMLGRQNLALDAYNDLMFRYGFGFGFKFSSFGPLYEKKQITLHEIVEALLVHQLAGPPLQHLYSSPKSEKEKTKVLKPVGSCSLESIHLQGETLRLKLLREGLSYEFGLVNFDEGDLVHSYSSGKDVATTVLLTKLDTPEKRIGTIRFRVDLEFTDGAFTGLHAYPIVLGRFSRWDSPSLDGRSVIESDGATWYDLKDKDFKCSVHSTLTSHQ